LASDKLRGPVDERLREPHWGRLYGVLRPHPPEAVRVSDGHDEAGAAGRVKSVRVAIRRSLGPYLDDEREGR
jgi:hypothetical protein